MRQWQNSIDHRSGEVVQTSAYDERDIFIIEKGANHSSWGSEVADDACVETLLTLRRRFVICDYFNN